MTNSEWSVLSDTEKGQLVSLWIIAADKNGALPTANATILKKIAQLDTVPNISKFIELGFLSTRCQPDDNQMTHQRREEKSREEKSSASLFDKFWSFYPRKINKSSARKWWLKNIKTQEKGDVVISGLKKQLPLFSEKEKQYIPHPTTWLRGERWDDEVEQAPSHINNDNNYNKDGFQV